MPLAGVTACARQIGFHPHHIAGDKYLCVVVNGVDGLPLIIPALGESIDQAVLLDSVDGLFFTGSPLNIESRHYGGPTSEPGILHDPDHDAITLSLARTATGTGIPVLDICRGPQETNVTFGGSLHQKIHEVETLTDHCESAGQPLEVRYAPRHAMYVQPGGVPAGIGLSNEFQVNSIHGQGVDHLASGLRVEASAPDGLVEAISAEGAKASILGVWWYPEWQVLMNPSYLAISQAFGKARDKRVGQR